MWVVCSDIGRCLEGDLVCEGEREKAERPTAELQQPIVSQFRSGARFVWSPQGLAAQVAAAGQEDARGQGGGRVGRVLVLLNAKVYNICHLTVRKKKYVLLLN